jgi:DNA-binding NtrC family response regulator
MTETKSRARILVIDDDRIILESLCELARTEGYDVEGAACLQDALRLVDQAPVDLVLTDVNMPGGDGFEVLHILRKRAPQTVAIMMTAYGTIDSAVEAIKLGAYDYLTKPIVDEDLLLCLERALNQQRLLRENSDLKKRLDLRFGLKSLIGHDYRMLKVFELIETIADSKANVLIQGESGTGKSLVARVLHQCGDRRDKPFVEVSCGAIPEGLLESELFGHVRGSFTGAVTNKVGKFKAADGGTIFLDEIATASPALQVKLLRVLQTRQFEPLGSNKTETVDVRAVFATNLDLAGEVAAGRFRQDLYYRIHVVAIQMPPLRERLSDIPLLARAFLDRFSAEAGRTIVDFEEEALRALQRHDWPGNVRELENAVERAVVLSRARKVAVGDLPPHIATPAQSEPTADDFRFHPMSLQQALEEPERRIIEAALRANNWNRQETAAMLEINRSTLYKKMKRYELLRDPTGVGLRA